MQSETIIRNQMLFDVLGVADSCCWAHGPAGLGVLVVEMVPPVLVSGPNLLPVAPTIASHGPAGLGVLGVETVDTETGGNRRKKASFFDVSGNNKCGYVNVREITGQITGQYVRASA